MWWEIKDHLEVRNNELYIAGYSAIELANKFGTPIYVYNGKRVIENYRRFYNALKKYADREVRIHYSMKANSNPAILRILKEEDSWIDAVSPEEVILAINEGFEEGKVLFTGSSLSHEDLEAIKKYRIRINVDSFSCLKKMIELKMKHEISFRIDPGIQGVGHSWRTITAGKEAHGVPIKFSIPAEEINDIIRFALNNGFKIKGLQQHVGSNWLKKEEIDEFLEAMRVLVRKAKEMKKEFNLELEFIDVGGGPGVRYREDQNDFPLEYYARNVFEIAKECDTQAIAFEPGRYIVADAGILLVKVTDIKNRYGEKIIGVNSGFNHLIRPVLYGSYHEIVNCNRVNGEKQIATIVGNLCETGDVVAVRREMTRVEEGDILAILNAGAYGYVMSSRYNSRKLPKEVLIKDGQVLLFEETYNKSETILKLP